VKIEGLNTSGDDFVSRHVVDILHLSLTFLKTYIHILLQGVLHQLMGILFLIVFKCIEAYFLHIVIIFLHKRQGSQILLSHISFVHDIILPSPHDITHPQFFEFLLICGCSLESVENLSQMNLIGEIFFKQMHATQIE
jgi:hypothetical protein